MLLNFNLEYVPKLTEHYTEGKTRKAHTDIYTGKEIPKGAECYKVSARYDTKLYAFYLTPDSYKLFIEAQEKAPE